MAISKKTFLGIARETTPGTAVTTPTRYIPCKGTIKGMRKPEYSDEDRNSRDKNFHVVYGPRKGEVDIKGGWFNDASVPLLLGVMGSLSSAQPDSVNVPTVYKHTLTLADTPPTFTFVKSYQSQSYYLPYAAVEKLALKWSSASKAVECDATILSQFPQILGSPPTPAFTTVRQFSGYMPKITLGSLGSTSDISDFQISIDQKIEMWNPSNGIADYVGLYFGEREVKVDFTARFDVSTLFTQWNTITDDSVTIDIQGDLIGSHTGTNYYQELNLNMPIVNYDSFDWDEGKINVLVKVKGTCRPAPDLSTLPLTAFVQNTVTSYANG